MEFILYDAKLVPRPHGFNNTGSICWLNSLTQSLFSLPGFNQTALTSGSKNKALRVIKQALLTMLSSDVTARAVLSNSAVLSNMITTYASTRRDRELFGSGQQCAREGFHMILDMLKNPKVEMMFTHRYRHDITCSACRSVISSKKEENTMFEIEPDMVDTGSTSVAEFLRKTNSETYDFRCSACGDTRPKSRISTLVMVPEVLPILIKKYKVVNGTSVKMNVVVPFPEFLEFKGTTKTLTYRVVATVEHAGSVSSGHYWSQCLRPSGDQLSWHNINDSSVMAIQPMISSDAGPRYIGTNETYMVFYHIIS